MATRVPRDYYEVLGVDRSADEAAIKKAFRVLARELHPDVNEHDPDAEEKFKEAAEAYEVLSDPERRRTYDAFGHEGLRTGGFSPHNAGGMEDILARFFGRSDSLFADLFGFGGPPGQGADALTRVEIALDDVLTGARREVTVQSVAECDRCHGSGGEPGTEVTVCPTCGGAGQVQQVSRSAFGQMIRTGPCPDCRGTGRQIATPCTECGGAGRIEKPRTWEVDIPAGIDSGQRIRIAGGGHAGERGAGSGDLYVEVRVAPDERFQREGTDLVTVIPVAATDAMVGSTVAVPSLDGDQQVKVKQGTQHGDRVVLRGNGLPPLHGGRRGDLYVLFRIVVPTRLGRAERKLAEELAEAIGPENLEID
jgi:molecular chaperone DnaJ